MSNKLFSVIVIFLLLINIIATVVMTWQVEALQRDSATLIVKAIMQKNPGKFPITLDGNNLPLPSNYSFAVTQDDTNGGLRLTLISIPDGVNKFEIVDLGNLQNITVINWNFTGIPTK